MPIANVPERPAVPACATKVAGLSTSLMVSVPEVLIAAGAMASVRMTLVRRQNGRLDGAEDADLTGVAVPSALTTVEAVGVVLAVDELDVGGARGVVQAPWSDRSGRAATVAMTWSTGAAGSTVAMVSVPEVLIAPERPARRSR